MCQFLRVLCPCGCQKLSGPGYSLQRRSRLSASLAAAPFYQGRTRTCAFDERSYGHMANNSTEIESQLPAASAAQVLTTRHELSDIEPAWEKLRTALVQPHLEQRSEWLDIEAKSAEGMMVVTLGTGSMTQAIAPFLLKRWRLQCRLGYKPVVSFPMRVARLCGDTLLSPSDERIQEALMDAVANADVAYDMLMIEALPVNSPLRRVLDRSRAVQRNFWTYFPGAPTKHWIARLPRTFGEYETWFGGKPRAQLKSKERKLAAACGSPVRLQRVCTPADLPDFFEAVSQLSKVSWKGHKLGMTFQPGDAQSRRIAEFAARGLFRGYLLRCDGGPIAFVIGAQSDGVYHYQQPGYDPQWSAFAPGNVTLYRLIEDLCLHDPAHSVDFGYGDNQYKQVFGTESFDEQNVLLARRSLRTGLALATHSSTRNLTSFVRWGLNKTGLHARVRRLLRSA